MVAGTLRHLHSLRRLRADQGWIKTLLEESYNERMHLLTFLELYRPGPLMRLLVFVAQGIFYNFLFAAYLISPSFCHRFVGYLEEEAVHTYTRCLAELDKGCLPQWTDKDFRVPDIAVQYWGMQEGRRSMRDLLLLIRVCLSSSMRARGRSNLMVFHDRPTKHHIAASTIHSATLIKPWIRTHLSIDACLRATCRSRRWSQTDLRGRRQLSSNDSGTHQCFINHRIYIVTYSFPFRCDLSTQSLLTHHLDQLFKSSDHLRFTIVHRHSPRLPGNPSLECSQP